MVKPLCPSVNSGHLPLKKGSFNLLTKPPFLREVPERAVGFDKGREGCCSQVIHNDLKLFKIGENEPNF